MVWNTQRQVQQLLEVAQGNGLRWYLNDDDRTVLLVNAGEQDIARARFTDRGQIIVAMGRTNQRAVVWIRFPAHGHTPKPGPVELLANFTDWLGAGRPAQWVWRLLPLEVDVR